MMTSHSKKLVYTIGFIFSLFAIIIIWQRWFVVNFSPSMPEGLYLRVYPAEYSRGMTVISCLPDDVASWAKSSHILRFGMRCPNHVTPLLKTIAATENDEVIYSDDGVVVNGSLLRNTKPIHIKRLKKWGGINKTINVPKGQLLLLSQHNIHSFDGRYFGVTETNLVLLEVRPLWLW